MHNPSKQPFAPATLTLVALQHRKPVTRATNRPAKPAILLGAAWYPEQWPESRWATDLDLMQAAHMHVVRVGEFAWSTMEPSEGHFDFAWLDRAIAAAAGPQHRRSHSELPPPPRPRGSPQNTPRTCG